MKQTCRLCGHVAEIPKSRGKPVRHCRWCATEYCENCKLESYEEYIGYDDAGPWIQGHWPNCYSQQEDFEEPWDVKPYK